ncbi:MAG: PepSY domain-containing protein [bacterium]|nr:PepSY domain-containing protein [Gammaproteobacteria bacterium]
MKRLLFLVHRWLGVVMCLFFAMWFGSGIVMMYVDYPRLTEQERLAALPDLKMDKILVSAEEAMSLGQSLGQLDGPVVELKLTSIADRPAYQFSNSAGQLKSVYADTGELFRNSNEHQALTAVRSSGFASAGAPTYEQKIDMDQWTVSAGLHKHRPLHKVSIAGGQGIVLYVSDLTGQVVRDTNKRERFWNWLGSTLHWIYPVQLRRHADLWVDVIIVLSMTGIFSVVTGGIIGTMRLRLKNRVKGNAVSPYKGVAKWHHILGLLCLVFISTFIFSGLMSMGPWGIFASPSSVTQQVNRYRGSFPVDVSIDSWLDSQKLDRLKEVTWQRIAGQSHLVFSYSATDRQTRPDYLRDRIKAAIPLLLPDDRIVDVQVLGNYDDYYYSRHNQYRPLPVLRVKFDDEESTWFHLDMVTGEVVTRHTDGSRLERWLYHGLHSLDFSFLIERGLLWDLVVIFLCGIGFLFSITSVIIGSRQLKSKG